MTVLFSFMYSSRKNYLQSCESTPAVDMLNSEDTLPSPEDSVAGAAGEEGAPPLKLRRVMDKEEALSLRKQHVA